MSSYVIQTEHLLMTGLDQLLGLWSKPIYTARAREKCVHLRIANRCSALSQQQLSLLVLS